MIKKEKITFSLSSIKIDCFYPVEIHLQRNMIIALLATSAGCWLISWANWQTKVEKTYKHNCVNKNNQYITLVLKSSVRFLMPKHWIFSNVLSAPSNANLYLAIFDCEQRSLCQYYISGRYWATGGRMENSVSLRWTN